MKIKKRFELIAQEYIKLFCDKQDMEFGYWTGGIGGVASFIDQYFFSLDDIRLDIDTNQPKGLIFQWQDDGIDYNMETEKTKFINYNSYCMGLRYKDLK